MANRILPTSMAIALWAASIGRSTAQTEPPELRVAREKERVSRLELEAARTGEFYLVADAGASRLSLALSGVPLATYRVERVDLGLPPAEGAPTGSELNELYHCQAPLLRPPNEILPGEVEAPAEPPAAGKTEPTQRAARIGQVAVDCDGSLGLRLVSSSKLGFLESLRERLRLPGDPVAGTRVRIVLPEEDAERLFASLPSKLLLLVSRLPVASPTGPAAPPATTTATTAR